MGEAEEEEGNCTISSGSNNVCVHMLMPVKHEDQKENNSSKIIEGEDNRRRG